jgi:hypothetical protein
VLTRQIEFRELIDLSTDPHETVNLIDDPDYSGKLSELRGKIIELFMKKVLP